MAFSTDRNTSIRFRKNQFNYMHGTESRKKVERIDSRLQALRDWDDLSRFPSSCRGAHNDSPIVMTDTLSKLKY